ncbi:ribonuclease toxin immunity protein CdiI [Pseudomonas aeruginosa]|uniref:ribonuclease toxin immunity protein CdiI n=1 Tax=Pseudomonas aeruginosa TaxID=287 RepID=UPI0009A27A99|nr:ribonuclease toxin immunity protein CdiI [Pseudomonas aeruginosa]MDP5792968.1 ribonuclease toxin immunity protein CdiI [Pseudomonas aeruginosa]MDP5971149.1 ribonuclease toxin immunity protein CdiI [Pseudomonas aeruginosa]HBO6816741.1 ribonuclease toxin immunity protein CdiI [Pseudomonas aeruginosa]
MDELFGQPYNEADPCWVVMCYMDIMYSDGRFIKAIECIVNRWGYSTDGAYCNFPDENSPFDDEHFEGVEFSYGYPPKDEDTIVVSEAVCSKFIRLACEKYLQRHPEDTEKVKELLDKLSFWP